MVSRGLCHVTDRGTLWICTVHSLGGFIFLSSCHHESRRRLTVRQNRHSNVCGTCRRIKRGDRRKSTERSWQMYFIATALLCIGTIVNNCLEGERHCSGGRSGHTSMVVGSNDFLVFRRCKTDFRGQPTRSALAIGDSRCTFRPSSSTWRRCLRRRRRRKSSEKCQHVRRGGGYFCEASRGWRRRDSILRILKRDLVATFIQSKCACRIFSHGGFSPHR